MEKEVQVGQLVAGKYRIEQVLGRGGMGVVMAALHEQLNQRVALKFLTDNAYQHPEAVARFVREARAAVQIQSEHVARVMDVGTLESGAPYMVMEYLRGRDLKDVSTRRGAMPVTEAVDYVLQACDALAEAHSLGIVHRDLKPSNLFLTERPDGSALVKVLDFGISKALHKGDTSQMQMTASAAIMGSPQYMSPEQIRSSKNVDARADVWALGTILHELLTGSPAYVADTVPGLLAMIVADSPPPLSASRPDAPPELEAAILRCLQKDRDQRFSSVSELARALERFASNEVRPLVKRIARILGDSAPMTSISNTGSGFANATRDSSGHSQTNGTWARTGRISNGAAPVYQRPGVLLGAVLGVAGVCVGGWFLLRSVPADIVTPTALEPARSAPAAAASGSAAPAAVVPGAVPAASPAANRAGTALPSPSVGVVRPITTPPEPQREPEPEPASNTQLDDDLFVKEAKSRVDQDSAAARSAKKKGTSATSAADRTRPAATRPRAPSSPREPSESGATPAAAASKKSNTLDLFNDTK
jgi:eukaryotic-like serine/threonine-protein kinase